MGNSYYDLLGVSEDATTEEIEQAYRKKLKETHPDVSDSEDANERTKEILDAKETLTDETERDRYDRLGHDAYVDSGTFSEPASPSSAQRAAEQVRQTTTSTADANGTTGRQRRTGSSPGTNKRERRGRNSSNDNASQQERTYTENVGQGATWAKTSSRDQESNPRESNQWRAWSSDRAYAVDRGTDVFRLGKLFKQQHVLAMLGATFLVYPVLLFGALRAPLGINFFIAACLVFVIAFLQSIPEVGIVVFAAWTLLLPPILLVAPGMPLFSLQSIIAMTAVVFPLGLSALTRVAIRPVTAN